MVSPEQAKAYLASLARADWRERRLVAAEQLGGAVRLAAVAVLAPAQTGDVPVAEREELARTTLAELDDQQRATLWLLLFPRMTEAVERAWQLVARPGFGAALGTPTWRLADDGWLLRERRLNLVRWLAQVLGPYDPTLAWVAEWSAHLGATDTGSRAVGTLLAAALEAGDEAVLAILAGSADGTALVGAIGYHLVRGLLYCSRPEAWLVVERLLLSAGLEDGLRAHILSVMREGHPAAFARLVGTLAEHGLARFPAVRQGISRWLGYGVDDLPVGDAEQALSALRVYLTDPAAREAAVTRDDAVALHRALWASAHLDAAEGARLAIARAADASLDCRYAALRVLAGMPLELAEPALLAALDADDLRLALVAVAALLPRHGQWTAERFEQITRLALRLPAKSITLPPLVHRWWAHQACASDWIWRLLQSGGPRPIGSLLALLGCADPEMRWRTAHSLSAEEVAQPAIRAHLLAALGDGSSKLRAVTLAKLDGICLTTGEAAGLEHLLSRKPPDLRQGALKLLRGQPTPEALASAERLLAVADPLSRLGGLELLRHLAEADRQPGRCRELAEAYRQVHGEPSADEQVQLDVLLTQLIAAPTAASAFGLVDRAELLPAQAPRALALAVVTPAAETLLASLFGELLAQRQTLVEHDCDDGRVTAPLAAARPRADYPGRERGTKGDASLPLLDHWLAWYAARPRQTHDADGCELVRAAWIWEVELARERLVLPGWAVDWYGRLVGEQPRGQASLTRWVRPVLAWLLAKAPPEPAVAKQLLLAATEAALAALPPSAAEQPERWTPALWLISPVLELASRHRRLWPEAWSGEDRRRFCRWQVWAGDRAEQIDGGRRSWRRPLTDDLFAAFSAGAVGDVDLLEAMLGPMQNGPRSEALWLATSRRQPDPRVAALGERCAHRVLDLELARGDEPSGATHYVNSIRSLSGSRAPLAIIRGLGKDGFRREQWRDRSRGASLSRLLRISQPDPTEPPEAAVGALRAAELPERRLCEAALVAPQWAGLMGEALGWPGFASAVWWLYAHTRDRHAEVDEELRALWAAGVTERTALTSDELLDGAADAAWFHGAITALGEPRFDRLYAAASLIGTAQGHRRARLFADAMLGRVSPDELRARIAGKRSQDALRALALAPLPGGDALWPELQARYQTIAEFERTSAGSGAQRRESERLACATALDSLASSAGYADAQRLRWAMATRAVAYLSDGPATVEVDGVTVALSLDGDGRPRLAVRRAGRVLKSVPAALSKRPEIADLRDRRLGLERGLARLRASLEQAMCRGDGFTARELRELLAHPQLAPALTRLVWLADGAAGYLTADGRALRGHDGSEQSLPADAELRLAHPLDLLSAGDWHLWQRECFAAQRVQPFRQLFREVYPLTNEEREAGALTWRYAGHQVASRQALALLGARGWVPQPEEGLRRTWHEAGLSAWLRVDEWFGAWIDYARHNEPLTLHSLHFCPRGEPQPMPLAEVPPRICSEAMRDLDLVVSVAHLSGANPEATPSTVAARAALVAETCALLGLDNVRLDGRHALIDGRLGRYAVHLASAVTHLLPGGMLCLLPVDDTQRGRIWLPFADNDPRSAEVLAKVLLLARDEQIRDPAIRRMISG